MYVNGRPCTRAAFRWDEDFVLKKLYHQNENTICLNILFSSCSTVKIVGFDPDTPSEDDVDPQNCISLNEEVVVSTKKKKEERLCRVAVRK